MNADPAHSRRHVSESSALPSSPTMARTGPAEKGLCCE